KRGADLARLRKAPGLGLREHEPAVGDHVVLPSTSRDRLGLEAVGGELGRETRGPLVVAASGGAVVDLDVHAVILRGQPGRLALLEPPAQLLALALVAREDLSEPPLAFRGQAQDRDAAVVA